MTEISPHRDLWALDPSVAFLNHGSFGACPRAILERQRELRDQMERQPVAFFLDQCEALAQASREAIGGFVNCDPEALAFVPNATTGINTILRSTRFEPGDELLVTDNEYGACRNALDFVARQAGAKVVVVEIPFPVASSDEVVERVRAAVTDRTRLMLIDHVTSATGMVLPLERILPELRERGVDSLVDGAHAPGMVDVDLEALGATYYTANCHKWICAPKGSGFLYVPLARQPAIRPLVISHGATIAAGGKSLFRNEFDWPGTQDPTGYLCVGEAIRYMGSLLPGGWDEVRASNRAMALAARDLLTDTLGIDNPCPDDMIGSLAAVPVPDGSMDPPTSPLYADSLRSELLAEHAIEVPVMPFPAPPKRLLRISAQLYNCRDDYQRLASALSAKFS